MDEQQATVTTPAREGLRRNSLNLPRLAFIGLAFVSEISLPFKTGSSIVWFSLAWAVIGIVWALWWSRRRQLTSISLSVEV